MEWLWGCLNKPIGEYSSVRKRGKPSALQLFSSVFTDFHLFSRLLRGTGGDVPATEVDQWLATLGMHHKVEHGGQRLSDVRFSQGQRKRLALLMAAVEQRDCLLLDEWAADQDPQFRQFFYHELLPALQSQGKPSSPLPTTTITSIAQTGC